MTKEERRSNQYNEMIAFMVENYRRLSKYNHEERNSWNRHKHTKKLLNAGSLKQERFNMFNKLVEKGEKYIKVNQ